MKRSGATIAVLALLLNPTAVLAHGKATGIVKERMTLMVILRDAMKTLKGELASGGGYDAGTVVRTAGTVRAHAGAAMTGLFPAGSTAHSEALPTVWTEPERFARLAEDLAEYAGAMQLAAQTRRMEAAPALAMTMGGAPETPDPATLATLHPAEAFGAVSVTCSACHGTYRMKKE
jgi:cytochrome c556